MRRLYKLIVYAAGAVFIASEVVIGAAQLGARDVLAAYRTLMPGQPIDGIGKFPCHLQVGIIDDSEIAYCQFEAEDGVFSRVSILVADHIITRADFIVAESGLSLGDSILCWGNPMYVPRSFPEASLNLYWDSQLWALISTEANPERPDYFLPISYLSIQHRWKPVDRERLACAYA